jgi:hypothetical protein
MGCATVESDLKSALSSVALSEAAIGDICNGHDVMSREFQHALIVSNVVWNDLANRGEQRL